jgi:hypothetical protein
MRPRVPIYFLENFGVAASADAQRALLFALYHSQIPSLSLAHSDQSRVDAGNDSCKYNVPVPLWSLFTFGHWTILAQGHPTISWQPCSCTRYTAQLLFKRMSSHNCAPHLAVFRCLSDARAKVRMTCVRCRHSHRCHGTWCVASRGPSALVPARLRIVLLGCRQTLHPDQRLIVMCTLPAAGGPRHHVSLRPFSFG